MDEESKKGIFITSDPDLTSIEQPRTGAAGAVPGLPLRLLLVSNLAPQGTEVDWAEGSRLRAVDKYSFDEALRALNPKLHLEVPNRVSKTPRHLEVDLGFADLEAFHPVEVAQQIPPVAHLLQVRTLVAQVQEGAIDLDAFRSQLSETGVDEAWAEQLYQALAAPPSPPAAQPEAAGGEGSALDRLFGLVDVGGGADDEAEPPPEPPAGDAAESLFGALVDAVAGEADARPKVARTAAEKLLADLDELLGEQVDAVFSHPDFRQLEAAWRGLKLLVDRLDFRGGVELEILAASKADLSEALYYQVLIPEHQGDTGKAPLSAVLLDYAFDHSSADLALLDDLADSGASLQTPLIASAAPAFFGVSTYAGLTKLPPLWQHFERPEYISFNKLREKKEARFVSLALPAFLLRPPYGADRPVKAFRFEESAGLWGHAALAVGLSVASSFVQTGWPTHLLGSERRIENLPLYKSAQGHIPLAVLLPDSKLSDYVKGGFVVLNGQTNRDFAYLTRAQTLCRPEAFEDLMAATQARIHVTLACQLFVARAAHYVLAMQEEITASEDVAALLQEIEARMRAFFHTERQTLPKEAVEIEHVAEAGLPEHELFAVRLRTPRHVLDREISLVLGVRVPKSE